jgi:glutathione S-transferase
MHAPTQGPTQALFDSNLTIIPCLHRGKVRFDQKRLVAPNRLSSAPSSARPADVARETRAACCARLNEAAMTENAITLHMFPASHFNEKARWALDWKGLPHARIPYLPGPHAPQMLRLSGQQQTPVLVLQGRVIAGSANIVDALERAFPERPLYPADPAARERALEVQRRFDAEVGPAVRTVVFAEMLHELDYLCAVFTRGQPAWKRSAYRALAPLVTPLIRKGNAVTAENVPRARARTEQALDEAARLVGPSGQIAGDAFSVADLTVAALLAPLLDLPGTDMARPQPVPARVEAMTARFAKHEAIAWVRAQYAKHRQAAAAAA